MLLSTLSIEDGFAIKEVLKQSSLANIILHKDVISPSQPATIPLSFISERARQAVVLQGERISKHFMVKASRFSRIHMWLRELYILTASITASAAVATSLFFTSSSISCQESASSAFSSLNCSITSSVEI